MDLINTLKGEGTGVAKNKTTQVEYELGIYQHWLTVGSDKAVPGLQEVHGWIRPVFGNDREMLTLEMNDERTPSSFPSRIATEQLPRMVG